MARVIREAHFKFVVILTGVLKCRSLRVATHSPVHHREKYTAVAFVGSDQTTLFTQSLVLLFNLDAQRIRGNKS